MSRLVLGVAMFTAQFTFGAAHRDVEYSRPHGQSLRLDAGVPEGKGPFPAVILVHGGGWIGGDRQFNVAPLFDPLSRAGIAWFSISYRLATDFLRLGAAVDDVSEAVRFVRRNAAEFNIDPDRVALLGESAGAHLASLAAMRDPKSVSAVVALYSPSDLETLAKTSNAIPSQLREAVRASGFAELILEHLRSLSPIQHVRAGLPPFLLVHGTADTLVPYDQSVRMLERLKAAGVPAELLAVERGGHGLRAWERSPALASYRTEMVNWLLRTLRQTALVG
jgi:alpha-L-fucosidase 2